jgi:hypothetical protein
MKRLLYLLPLMLFACKKDKTPVSLGTLGGQWVLYQYWNSPGSGPVIWHPATSNKTIYFNADLVFHSNKSNEDHYILIHSPYGAQKDTLLQIYQKGKSDTTSYGLRYTSDTLVLSLIGCIEGCKEKFIKLPPVQ